MRLKFRWIIAAFLVFGALTVGAFAHPSIRARLFVIGLKAGGRLGTVKWKQVLSMMKPGSPAFELASSANPFAAITNPLGSSLEEKAKGKQIFDRQCAKCHGDTASGGMGPPLVGRELSQGASDWAL